MLALLAFGIQANAAVRCPQSHGDDRVATRRRSPPAVAEWLASRVTGHSFVEIGAARGDISACLSHFASSVIAIEVDSVLCKVLRARGLQTICSPLEPLLKTGQLPRADRYFFWMPHTMARNWTRAILRAGREWLNESDALLFVGYEDWELQVAERKSVAQLGGQITRLPAPYLRAVRRAWFFIASYRLGAHEEATSTGHVEEVSTLSVVQTEDGALVDVGGGQRVAFIGLLAMGVAAALRCAANSWEPSAVS